MQLTCLNILDDTTEHVNVKTVNASVNENEQARVNEEEVQRDVNMDEVQSDVNMDEVLPDVNVEEVQSNVNVGEVQSDVNVRGDRIDSESESDPDYEYGG